jgi:hypothetical protein
MKGRAANCEIPKLRSGEMMAGCPCRLGVMTVATNVRVKEAGWNCNIPSRIQKAPQESRKDSFESSLGL